MRRKTRELLILATVFVLVLSTLLVDAKSHRKHKHKRGKKKSVVSRSNIPQKPDSSPHSKGLTGVKKSEETWHQNDKPQELTPETIKIVKKQESIKASELPGAFGDDAQLDPLKSTADVKSQRQGAVSKAKVTKAKKVEEKPTNPTEAITIVDKQDHGGRVPGAKFNHKKIHSKKGKKYIPYVVKDKKASKIKSDEVEDLGDKLPSKSKTHKKKTKNKKKQTSIANAIVQRIVKLASASEQEDNPTEPAKHVEPVTHKSSDSLPSTPKAGNAITVAHHAAASRVEKKLSKAKGEKKKKIKDIAAEEGDDSPVRSLLDELAADEDEDEESGSAMSEIASGAEALSSSNEGGKVDEEPDIECPWACFWRCENYCPKKCCHNPYHCPEECSMFCTTRCPDKCCPPGMKKLPDVQVNFQGDISKQSPVTLLSPQPPPPAQPQQQQFPNPQYMSQQQVAQQASAQTGYPGYCPLFCPNVCVPSSCQPECCGQQANQYPVSSSPQTYYPPPPQPMPAIPPAQFAPPPSPPAPPPVYNPQPPPSYSAAIPSYCPDICATGCASQCPNECCSGMGRR